LIPKRRGRNVKGTLYNHPADEHPKNYGMVEGSLIMASRISQDDYKQALARGRHALAEPHVVSARYIAHTRVLELVYSNGLALRIDPKEVPALKDLPRQVLAQAYVTPGGDGLAFGEEETAAISIPSLVAGMIPIDIARRTVAAASTAPSRP